MIDDIRERIAAESETYDAAVDAEAEAIETPNGRLATAYETLRQDMEDADAAGNLPDNGARLAAVVGEDVPNDELAAIFDAAQRAFTGFALQATEDGIDPEGIVRGGIATVLLLGMELGAALRGGGQ